MENGASPEQNHRHHVFGYKAQLHACRGNEHPRRIMCRRRRRTYKSFDIVLDASRVAPLLDDNFQKVHLMPFVRRTTSSITESTKPLAPLSSEGARVGDPTQKTSYLPTPGTIGCSSGPYTGGGGQGGHGPLPKSEVPIST